MPHDLPGDHVADKEAALAQYEREKHLMPSGKPVTRQQPDEPTIADIFRDAQRLKYAGLIAEARKVAAGDCFFGHDYTRGLVTRLADVLEGRG